MKTMVEVFNQLTQEELAGCDLFKEVLGNHFEKFRYFYKYSGAKSELDKAKKMSCFTTDNGIVVTLYFSSKKKCEEYHTYFTTAMNESDIEYDKYLLLSVRNDGEKCLNISVEGRNISKEEDIYEDRFNSY